MSNDGIVTLRVPQTLMDQAEVIAKKRRRARGVNCQRSEIAREAMEIGLAKLTKSDRQTT